MRNGISELFGQLKYMFESMLCRLNVPVAILEYRGVNAIKFQLKLLVLLFFVFINFVNILKLKIYINDFVFIGESITVIAVMGGVILLSAEALRLYFAYHIIRESFAAKKRVGVLGICVALTLILDSAIALIINYVIPSNITYPQLVTAAHKVVLKYVESL